MGHEFRIYPFGHNNSSSQLAECATRNAEYLLKHFDQSTPVAGEKELVLTYSIPFCEELTSAVGKPIILEHPTSTITDVYKSLASKVIEQIPKLTAGRTRRV